MLLFTSPIVFCGTMPPAHATHPRLCCLSQDLNRYRELVDDQAFVAARRQQSLQRALDESEEVVSTLQRRVGTSHSTVKSAEEVCGARLRLLLPAARCNTQQDERAPVVSYGLPGLAAPGWRGLHDPAQITARASSPSHAHTLCSSPLCAHIPTPGPCALQHREALTRENERLRHSVDSYTSRYSHIVSSLQTLEVDVASLRSQLQLEREAVAREQAARQRVRQERMSLCCSWGSGVLSVFVGLTRRLRRLRVHARTHQRSPVLQLTVQFRPLPVRWC
jgi:hypothetical protein